MTPQLPTAAQTEALQRWRAMALQRMPYFASMLFSLRPFNAAGLGTFAVDPSHRLYVDFDHVESKGDRWCSEVLLHESMHLFFEHARRFAQLTSGGLPAHPMLSNIASDAEINDDLVEAGCTALEADGVLPSRLGLESHQTFEHYYTELLKKMDPNTLPQSGGCGSGAGGPTEGCELPADGGELGANGRGLSQVEADLVAINTAAAVKQAGSAPGGLVAHAELVLTPPQVPWQRLLASKVRRGVSWRAGDDDVTYRRPDRRRRVLLADGRRVVFPSTYSPTPSILVIVDSSGSVSPAERSLICSEVAAISRQLNVSGPDLRFADADTQLYDVREYRTPSDFALRQGNGGTDMAHALDQAAELLPTPSVIVVATDGFTPWPASPLRNIAVIACLVGSADRRASVTSDVPSWIETVWVDEAPAQRRHV